MQRFVRATPSHISVQLSVPLSGSSAIALILYPLIISCVLKKSASAAEEPLKLGKGAFPALKIVVCRVRVDIRMLKFHYGSVMFFFKPYGNQLQGTGSISPHPSKSQLTVDINFFVAPGTSVLTIVGVDEGDFKGTANAKINICR